MSATVWNWIVVYSDGTTETVSGDTPTAALYDLEGEEYDIVSIVRNGW